MTDYTYTYHTKTSTWDISPIPPYIDGTDGTKIPQFDCGDRMSFEIKKGGAEDHHHPHAKHHLTFKKKAKPHCSGLPTPFRDFNGKEDKSPYPYTLGTFLTFAENDEESYKARWTFHLSPLESTANLDNDPELQVGTGRPPEGGDGDE